jgi:pimeloyl-ACP methyl ester carboxylesterase
MPESLQFRTYGSATQPTLVYLPGTHGDWTLIGSFRRAVSDRVRFIETTYPRTLTWSLEDYAGAVEAGLAELGIKRGWLLAESFSSQVGWQLLARKRFEIQGLILAGGFVRHPMRWGVRLAERVLGQISLSVLTRILFGYAKVSRWRFHGQPEVLAAIEEFIARRTELDRQAAKHRLKLIFQSDLCAIARGSDAPIYAMTGVWDPVVPWYWVRRWLKTNCPALREYKIIGHADHNVLSTAPQVAADLVANWMKALPQ